jgi:hypothetical protein
MPLCCQQRTGPWTRREQGVPFFVRAPQMNTASVEVVGEVDWLAACVGFVPAVGGCPSFSGESDRLTITSGGDAGRRTRPTTYPPAIRLMLVTSKGSRRVLRNLRAQVLQNRRLVQTCQRNRSSFSPHSAQKLGLYILECGGLTPLCIRGDLSPRTLHGINLPSAATGRGLRKR